MIRAKWQTVWAGSPVRAVRMTGPAMERSLDQITSLDGVIAILLHVERPCRGASEFHRWTE